jgi:hypothetical protein
MALTAWYWPIPTAGAALAREGVSAGAALAREGVSAPGPIARAACIAPKLGVYTEKPEDAPSPCRSCLVI